MSVEEDIELKNLVAQTLENKGILPKIRAELRANVFLALEENPDTKDTLLRNDELSAFLKVPISTLVLNLIREFLEFFELEFTLSVFEPETKYGKDYNGIPRDKMLRELKIPDYNKKNPLLLEVINKIININKSETTNVQFCTEERELNDPFSGGEAGNLTTSPQILNTTYVKKAEVDSIQLSSINKDSKDDSNESIKEVMSNNFSESESLSEVQLDLNIIPNVEVEQQSYLQGDTGLLIRSTKAPPKETIEIDLLTFTPTKEQNEKETKSTAPQSVGKKTDKETGRQKSSSVLGDLPPLNAQPEEKDFDMNDLKAIIDDWSDKSVKSKVITGVSSNKSQQDTSVHLKSDLSDNLQSISQKSDNTGDFEEDSSDLMNGHTPLDTPKTVDETISKVSCAADYLESV